MLNYFRSLLLNIKPLDQEEVYAEVVPEEFSPVKYPQYLESLRRVLLGPVSPGNQLRATLYIRLIRDDPRLQVLPNIDIIDHTQKYWGADSFDLVAVTRDLMRHPSIPLFEKDARRFGFSVSLQKYQNQVFFLENFLVLFILISDHYFQNQTLN